MRIAILVFAVLAAACDTRAPAVQDSAAGDVAEVQGSFILGLNEWKVDAPIDTLPAGKYTFRVENNGKHVHALEIEGNGREYETGELKPGAASELTVELTPGTYELYCPVSADDVKHEARGMKRKLVVRAS